MALHARPSNSDITTPFDPTPYPRLLAYAGCDRVTLSKFAFACYGKRCTCAELILCKRVSSSSAVSSTILLAVWLSCGAACTLILDCVQPSSVIGSVVWAARNAWQRGERQVESPFQLSIGVLFAVA